MQREMEEKWWKTEKCAVGNKKGNRKKKTVKKGRKNVARLALLTDGT